MPENAVSVTRPGEFGNPFAIGGLYKIGNGQSMQFAWLRCLDEKYNDGTFIKIETPEQAIEMYKKYMALYPLKKSQIEKLKGKDLACWCKEGELCHADHLLEIVNK